MKYSKEEQTTVLQSQLDDKQESREFNSAEFKVKYTLEWCLWIVVVLYIVILLSLLLILF